MCVDLSRDFLFKTDDVVVEDSLSLLLFFRVQFLSEYFGFKSALLLFLLHALEDLMFYILHVVGKQRTIFLLSSVRVIGQSTEHLYSFFSFHEINIKI